MKQMGMRMRIVRTTGEAEAADEKLVQLLKRSSAAGSEENEICLRL